MSTRKVRHVGTRIKELREKKSMALAELARKSGISRGYLYLLEKGESNPTEEKLAAIADALGVLMSELTGEIESYDDLPIDIPETLREFAEQRGLSNVDVLMLSRINYRGRRPNSVADWQALYFVIKGVLGDRD